MVVRAHYCAPLSPTTKPAPARSIVGKVAHTRLDDDISTNVPPCSVMPVANRHPAAPTCPHPDAEHFRHRRERQAEHLLTLPFAGRTGGRFILHEPLSRNMAVHTRAGAGWWHARIYGTPGRRPQLTAPTLSPRAERDRPGSPSVRLSQPKPTVAKNAPTSWRTTPSLDHRSDDNVTGRGAVRRGCV